MLNLIFTYTVKQVVKHDILFIHKVFQMVLFLLIEFLKPNFLPKYYEVLFYFLLTQRVIDCDTKS